MKYKFQHYFDIATSAESMQVINVSAGGSDVVQRCAHLFGAYKYFKLGKVSLKLVPASTLPVDPLGLSYDDDDPQSVDPRDQLNPGLVRITNGEDIMTDISSLTDDQQHAVYNAMMLDPRWYKWQLQSGMRRSAVPLYWQIGQLHQDYFPGSTINVPQTSGTQIVSTETEKIASFGTATGTANPWFYHHADNSDPRGLFQVGHRGRMGYLPTDALVPHRVNATDLRDQPLINAVPEIQCFTIVLPKAFKTVYYYRAYITQEVYFTGLKTIGVPDIGSSIAYQSIAGLDQFIKPFIGPSMPQEARTLVTKISQENNGDDV